MAKQAQNTRSSGNLLSFLSYPVKTKLSSKIIWLMYIKLWGYVNM